LAPAVAAGAQDYFERWDGSGIPAGRRGEEIDLLAQIIALCGDLEIYSRVFGLPKALQLVETQAGRHYDPALTRLGLKHAPAWLAQIDGLDAWPVAAAQASGAMLETSSDLDALAALLADYGDLKLPGDFLNSRKVAEIAALTASLLGFDSQAQRRLSRAALLHGLDGSRYRTRLSSAEGR
jgi:hypothetical protein